MMDILKRLNAEEDYTYPNWVAQQAERKEAAAEIERLREALQKIANGYSDEDGMRNIARSALQQKDSE